MSLFDLDATHFLNTLTMVHLLLSHRAKYLEALYSVRVYGYQKAV